jgi:hypothetical protein
MTTENTTDDQKQAEHLTEDLELTILTFCDITTVLRYGLCSHEKYTLVNSSTWLWEQHTRAELGVKDDSDAWKHEFIDEEQDTVDWKQEFIKVYSSQVCLDYNPPTCIGKCFSVKKGTVSRPDDELNGTRYTGGDLHCWEKILGSSVIKPRTIVQFEFIINRYYINSENGYRICLGVDPSQSWKHNYGFSNVVGAEDGLSFIVGTREILVNRSQEEVPVEAIESGDCIQFIMDNGYTSHDIVNLEIRVNGNKICENTKLPVEEYRPAISINRGQHVTIKRAVVLKK